MFVLIYISLLPLGYKYDRFFVGLRDANMCSTHCTGGRAYNGSAHERVWHMHLCLYSRYGLPLLDALD